MSTSEPALHLPAGADSLPRATLVPPNGHGYALLAAEVDRRPGMLPPSARKRELLQQCREQLASMRAQPGVLEATLFSSVLIPPGRGAFLRRRPGAVHIARYDLVVLVELESPDAARALAGSAPWAALVETVGASARAALSLTATNVRRIAEVDHTRPGVFLFNWFFADDTEQNLRVWEHTAGWFEQETRLDNSEVMLPDAGTSKYTIINHCRWDRLADVLPSLVLKPSFRNFVLDTFDFNDVAAMPILYRMV